MASPIDVRDEQGRHVTFDSSPKRIRVMFHGKTIVDSLCAGLMRERGRLPVYYFPRDDVRMDFLTRADHRTHCPLRGDASYWTLRIGERQAENAAWSYEDPPSKISAIKDLIAIDWQKADHWFEEDEEIFGHPRDPYHRVDVHPSSRDVRIVAAGETMARSRRGMFLFETGLPTRYYIPPADVRTDLLTLSPRTSICPYKGTASYWSARIGEHVIKDVAWGYQDPLPESARIRGYFCFYPEKVDEMWVEGEAPHGRKKLVEHI